MKLLDYHRYKDAGWVQVWRYRLYFFPVKGGVFRYGLSLHKWRT